MISLLYLVAVLCGSKGVTEESKIHSAAAKKPVCIYDGILLLVGCVTMRLRWWVKMLVLLRLEEFFDLRGTGDLSWKRVCRDDGVTCWREREHEAVKRRLAERVLRGEAGS